MGLAWDGTNLYVADPYNLRVVAYSIGAATVPYQGIRNAASLDITATGSLQVGGVIQAGDIVTITINSFTYSYTVQAADTIQTVTLAIIKSINSSNNGAGDPSVTAMLDPTNTTYSQIDLTARVPGDLGNDIFYSATLTPAPNQSSALIAVSAAGSTLTGGGDAAHVAPGTVVTITGTNLSAGTASADLTKPSLPTQLGGTQVYFNGIVAPLFMVSPTEINAQVPWELGDQTSVNAFVRSVMPNGSIMVTTAMALSIVPANPGLYFVAGTANPSTGILYHGSSFATSVVSVDGAPAAGATATITVNGRAYSYTSSALDTLDSIRNALVVQLNRDPQVSASMAGVFDRIILSARVAGPQGNGITITGSASGGSLVVTVFDPTLCCSNVAGSMVTPTNPAVPGELIVAYATGLGLPNLTDQISPLIQTGVQFPLNGPNTVPANFVSAIAGGSTADIIQATMQPGTVGGNQVVLHLNEGLITSPTTVLTIAQNDFTSNQVAFPLVSPSGSSGLDPQMTVVSTHDGNFYQGQQNALYTLTISNTGGGNPSVGLVTVTDTLPTGMTLVQMIGDGWNCSGNVCTRSDVLLATLSYPVITVLVNVSSTAASPLSNVAKATGGGGGTTTSTDPTQINTTAPSNPPSLSIAITHTGNFTKGQQNATYTLTVSNAKGVSSTSGSVFVYEVLPASMTLTEMQGSGWTCTNNECSRSDGLASGNSYPPITVTVTIAANAPSSVVNTAVVTGGGSSASVGTNTTTIQ